MIHNFKKATLLGLGASILAAQLAAAPAQAKTRTFKASEAAVKQACGGGTYFGKNSDGAYGCLSENGKAYTDCKKGKCTTFSRTAPTGGGDNGGRPSGGTNDDPSGGSNTNTKGEASLGNAGMSSGGGGGIIK